MAADDEWTDYSDATCKLLRPQQASAGDSVPPNTRQCRKQLSSRRLWSLAASCVLLIFAVSQVYILAKVSVMSRTAQQGSEHQATANTPPVHGETHDLDFCDCGSSVEEALAKDCVFDTLAAAWLPPYCRDADLTAAFEHVGPNANGSWPYFADEAGTVPLGIAALALLGESPGGTFWALREWHIAHCLYYWQKLVREKETGVVMERRFNSIHHVEHCTRLIMNKVPEGRILLEVGVKMNGALGE